MSTLKTITVNETEIKTHAEWLTIEQILQQAGIAEGKPRKELERYVLKFIPGGAMHPSRHYIGLQTNIKITDGERYQAFNIHVASTMIPGTHAHQNTPKIIIKAILDERKRQDEKWGDHGKNTNGKWLAILTEEVGEAARAILDENRTDAPASKRRVTGLEEELIQAAAVIIAWLEYMTPEEIR